MHKTTDVAKIHELIDIAIARAESRVTSEAEKATRRGTFKTAPLVTAALSFVDELVELKMHIHDVTSSGRRVPSWLHWMFPKVRVAKTNPIVSEEEWDKVKAATTDDWSGVFRG